MNLNAQEFQKSKSVSEKKAMKTFQEMPLPQGLQLGLKQLEFIEPTEVQAKVIPLASEGRDLMVCSETGSGKTGAYGIPMVCRLLEDQQRRGLVLAPTRELAHQISDFLRDLTANCKNFRVTSLVGGADMKKQLNSLKKKPQIIVATPGRLTDHLRRKSVKLHSTEVLVLDEGDRMLDMGFAPQLDEILKFLPKQRQTSLFTATLPKKVRELAKKYLNDPDQVDVGKQSLPVASIRQSVVEVSFKDKDSVIIDELNNRQGSVIVFARTKHRTDILAKILKDYGFNADVIHGGKTQGQRNKAIRNFKQGKCRILCATDIAARGIDVPQVEHVINFDLPMMDEDYVHRIGRTARNGAEGEAVSFVMPDEHRTWNILVNKFQIKGVELLGAPERGGKGGRKKKKSGGRPGARSGSGSRDGAGKKSFGKKAGGKATGGKKKADSWKSRKASDGWAGKSERYRASDEGAGENKPGGKKKFSRRKSSSGESPFRGDKPSGGRKFAKDDGPAKGGSKKVRSKSGGKKTFGKKSSGKKTSGGRPGGKGGAGRPSRGKSSQKSW